MASASPILHTAHLHTAQSSSVEEQHPRLSLKPPLPVTGQVDGGWWPRSRDLAAEIPALQAGLAERLGTVEGVSYHLGEWGTTTRRTSVEGHLVRLAGYHTQPLATVDVRGAQHRLTLLVVSPDAEPAAAHAALAAAGSPGNTDGIEALLHSPTHGTGADPVAQRGDLDGGSGRRTSRA